VVQDAQDEGLDHQRFGERRDHRHHRRAIDVHLTLPIGVDVAREAEVSEPAQRRGGHDLLGLEPAHEVIVEPEGRERFDDPADAGDHAVASSGGEPSGEDLEDAGTGGGAIMQCRIEHRELVTVGEQRGRGRLGDGHAVGSGRRLFWSL
jgi:hypothetical protein